MANDSLMNVDERCSSQKRHASDVQTGRPPVCVVIVTGVDAILRRVVTTDENGDY